MAARKKSRGASFEELAASFKRGDAEPLYLFTGTEGFLMDELQALAVEHLLQPAERDFNLDIVFGPEANARDVLAQCGAFPMMAQRRLVIVRGFDQLSDTALFTAYADSPNPQAVVLLLCNGNPRLNTNPYRAIKAKGVWARFDPLRSRDLPGWVRSRFQLVGVKAAGGTAQRLVDLVAPDLRTLATEVDKLVSFVGDRREVTPDDVVQAAGHSAEINPFGLQDALGACDVSRALTIADTLLVQAANRQSQAIQLIGLLASYFNKLWLMTACLASNMPDAKVAGTLSVPPFAVSNYRRATRQWSPVAVRRAFEALLAADAELKGGSRRSPRQVMSLLMIQLIRSVQSQ